MATKTGYYDPNKDYSLAIKQAQASGASQSQINRLQQERQNKINAQYGGTDPYQGSSNIMGSSGTSGRTTGTSSKPDSSSSLPSYSSSPNVDYHQQAIDAASKGDWGGVVSALSSRQEKINAQGGNDRGTSNQSIYQSLLAQYGTPDSGQQSRDETLARLYAGQMVGDQNLYLGQGWSSNTDYLSEALDAARRGDLDAAYQALERRGYKLADTGSTGGGTSQAQAYQMVQQAYGQSGALEQAYDSLLQRNQKYLDLVARPYDDTAQPENAYKTTQRRGSDGKMYYVTFDGNGIPFLVNRVGTEEGERAPSYSNAEIDAMADYYRNGFSLDDYYRLHNFAVDRTGVGRKYDENGILQLDEADVAPESLIPALQALGINPILNSQLDSYRQGQSAAGNGAYVPGGNAAAGLGGTIQSGMIQGGTGMEWPGMQGTGMGGTGMDAAGLSGGMLSFEDFLAQTGYDQYSAATQQRIQAAVQQAVNNYNAQIEQANRDTEDLARQAYIASMLGQKNLDQQLSAAGYAGGMADSQRIQMQANYENNLRDLETQRLEVVAELERAIQDAQLTGDIQSAQELQSYLQQMQGSWLSYVQNQQAMAQQDYWNRQQMLANQQQFNAEQQNTAYNRALQMLGMGIMPGTDLLSQANLSQQEAEAIRSSVLAELGSGTGTATSTTGSYRASNGTSRASGGTFNNGSLTASQVRQLQQALGVTADGMWGKESTNAAGGLTADEAWAAMQQQSQQTPLMMDYNDLKDTIERYLSLGGTTRAQNLLDKYWDSLTPAQQQELSNLYG